MNNKSHAKSWLIFGGLALILCLPLLTLAAGIYAYFLPRQFYSQTTLEVRTADPTDFLQTLQGIEAANNISAEVHAVRGTDLFAIGVYDTNPAHAAEQANVLAFEVLSKFAAVADADRHADADRQAAVAGTGSIQGQRHELPMHVFAPAVPALAPARPNVFRIMLLGVGAGSIFAGFGSFLLIMRLARRRGDSQGLPQAVAH
jgi:uncharacterized protein involved in exopolysaccharide biosynthesis